ncbi:MAG: zinc ABC transporter substrate-binding protein [Alphaproteobacteria bacterium]|nr:zinc ABC transporter substrate-binding protein [Alphaproteobacteria bacterium]
MWLLLLACTSPAPPPAPEAPPLVVGLSYPVCWLVDQLMNGTPLESRCFAVPGEDPPAWQPEGAAIAALADADLLVANGQGYEAWMATAALPHSRVVDSSAEVAPIPLSGRTHSHGGEAHSHSGPDPHTWMDPQSYLRQALAVRAALVERWPEYKERFDANQATLEPALVALDAELEQALAPAHGLSMAASHPAFNYLARRYGLDLRSFDLDPQAPDPAGAEAVAAWAAAQERPVLWWESPPSEAVTAALPQGIEHLFVDPLEQPPEGGEYDWMAQARVNVEALRAHFSAPRTAPGSGSR